MPLRFHKMHGAGNDFVLLDHRESETELDAALATRLSDRRLGVGCDQILVLKASKHNNCLVRYQVFNADGSTAGQCGNGVRCIALYLLMRGEFAADELAGDEPVGLSIRLEGPSGIVRVTLCEDGEFECAMGEPDFDLPTIPVDMFHATSLHSASNNSGAPGTIQLNVGDQQVAVSAVSMGNPHAVMVVDRTDTAPVAELGPGISTHAAFPDGCNAGFAEIIDEQNIRLRVFERGAGETLACGSGACAAVAALRRGGRVAGTVNVFLPGGHLVIKWDGPGSEVMMKGPARHVFRGTLDE